MNDWTHGIERSFQPFQARNSSLVFDTDLQSLYCLGMLIGEHKRPPNSVSAYFSGKLLLSTAEMKQKSESAVELP